MNLVNFISEGANVEKETWETAKPGIINGALLVITQLIGYLIQEHCDFWQTCTGVRASNALIAFIYEKNLKVSSATNKEFTSAEIVNFV
jgi:hypothetical protein